MTIHRMLQDIPLRPKEIARLVEAYERTLRKFGLKERDDPLTQLIAKKIIKVGQTGVRDPEQISQLVITDLRRP
jgi:hypothetical protein